MTALFLMFTPRVTDELFDFSLMVFLAILTSGFSFAAVAADC